MKKVSFTLSALFFFISAPSFAQSFGGALAHMDHTIFVSETNNSAFPGSVYIYADNEKPGTWIETGRITPEDGFPGDRFGNAMATAGNTLFVGMSGFAEATGAVMIYTKLSDGAWEHTSTLTAPDGLPEDQFGRSLAAEKDVVAIAAPGRDNQKGSVFVYRRQSDNSWTKEATLQGSDTDEGSMFGAGIAVSDNSLLVGAPAHNEAKGAAYLFSFDESANQWHEQAQFQVSSIDKRSRLGETVSLGHDIAYVGAPRVNNRAGAVYAFNTSQEAAPRRTPYRMLTAYDGARFGQFGSSIVATEDELWIGAPGDARIGSVYVFRNYGPQGWARVEKMMGEDLSGRPSFGTSLLRAGNTAVIGATGVDGGEGAALLFARNTETNRWNQQLAFVNDIKGFDAINGEEVKCENDKIAQFDCKGVSLMSFLPIKEMGGKRGTRVNDIWGWTDPQTDREYALVGRTDGTSFVDVTDPLYPRYLGQIKKTKGSRTSVWRDIKVYKDHAYIVADGAGQHGMQVFDLTRLRAVDAEPVDFDVDYLYKDIASAHNVVINESTGFAYAVGSSSGGKTCGGGLHMINIQQPKTPTFSGCFADTSTGRNNTGYSHDAQCVVYQGPDVDYQGKEICFGANENALSIADVSDKSNPRALSVTSYPKVAYTHQGWLTEDHKYFYMNDEGDEPNNLVEGTRTLIWDVTDLDDPILIKEHIAETTSTDHNLYIRGDLMYQSNYGSGFRILDISTPAEPVEVGFLDTTPYKGGGGGSWSNYPYFKSRMVIVTSSREGLFVVKKEDVAF